MASNRLNLQIGGGNPEEYEKRKVMREVARAQDKVEDITENFLDSLIEEVEKSCPPGHYFCFDDQKCKKIPGGHKVKQNGELVKEEVVYREPVSNVDVLSNYISKTVKEEPKPFNPRSVRETVSLEERITILEQDVFKQMAQSTPHTLVSGIGASLDSGGGAVWLWDLEDVDIGTPLDGVYPSIPNNSILQFDSATKKWKYGDAEDPGAHSSNLQTGGIIQRDGGEVNDTGNLIIRATGTGNGKLIVQDSTEDVKFEVGAAGTVVQKGTLRLGQCVPSNTSLSTVNTIELVNSSVSDDLTAPRLTLLNERTKTPNIAIVDGLNSRRYNLSIAAGSRNSILIQRGTDNGGWDGLYIQGKTTNYDSNGTGWLDNPTNDPKKYALLNIYRENNTGSGGSTHVADSIKYRGNTSSDYSIQNKLSVLDLINSGGGGVGFKFMGEVNVTIAVTSSAQPTHEGDLTDPTPGAFYINTTAGVAFNSGASNQNWTGIGGLTISADQLIIWSEEGQRWFAGAVEDNTSFLKINGTNFMERKLDVKIPNDPDIDANALQIGYNDSSFPSTIFYAGGSATIGGSLTLGGNFIPDASGTRNLGSTSKRWKDLDLSGDIDVQGSINVDTDLTVGGIGVVNGTLDVGGTLTMDADIVPVVNQQRHVGTSTAQFAGVYAKTVTAGSSGFRANGQSIMQGINPDTNGTRFLGNSSFHWKTMYLDSFGTDVLPDNNKGHSLGSSSKQWKELYVSTAQVSGRLVAQNIEPQLADTYNLGSSNFTWSTTYTDIIEVSGTTDSSSTTTGAIICSGGMGIAKNIHCGGVIFAQGTTNSTSATGGEIVCSGGMGIAKDVHCAGTIHANHFIEDGITWQNAYGLGSNVLDNVSYAKYRIVGGNTIQLMFAFRNNGAHILNNKFTLSPTSSFATAMNNSVGGGIIFVTKEGVTLTCPITPVSYVIEIPAVSGGTQDVQGWAMIPYGAP